MKRICDLDTEHPLVQRMEMRRVELNGRKSEVQDRQVGRTETRSMKSTKKLEGGRGRHEESGRRKRERER